jgi:hypothetical protein
MLYVETMHIFKANTKDLTLHVIMILKCDWHALRWLKELSMVVDGRTINKKSAERIV